MSDINNFTAEQKYIYDAKSENMLISAGAGCGKTFILVERVIHLLRDKGYKLKEMIILTFTELAAKEMKERIMKALKKENKQELSQELKHIDEASIETFDSFCHKFVNKYSCFSTLPKHFEIGNDEMFKMIIIRSLKDILKPYFNQSLPAFNEFVEIFDFSKENRIYEYLFDLYIKVVEITDTKDYLRNYLNNYFSNDFYNFILNNFIDIVKEKIEYIISMSIPKISSKINEYVEYIKTKFINILNSTDLNDYIDCLKEIKEIKKPRNDFGTKEEKDLIKISYDELREKLDSLINFLNYKDKDEIIEIYNSKKNVCQFLVNVLLELDDKVNEFKKEHGIYSFLDIEKETIRILRTHKEVSDYYKSKIKEILIDEYQDTNDIQSEIISLISNDNLIVVGDIKQSIYRFRNANPEIFKSLGDKYQKTDTGTVVELSKNFRSRKNEVLDIVNMIFTNIRKYPQVNMEYLNQDLEYGNVKYDSHESEMNKFRIIEFNAKESKDISEFDLIARDIYNRLNSGQMTYITKDNGIYRKAEPKDFMILASDNESLKSASKALKKYHIQSKVYGAKGFFKTKELIFLKNILKLTYLFENQLFDIDDFNITVLSIERSFLRGVSGDKILSYLDRSKYESNIIALIAEFRDLYDKMVYLISVLHKYNMYYVLKEAIKIFDLYEKLKTLDDYEEKEMRITHILDMMKTLSNSKMTLKDAVEYFDYLKGKDLDIDIKQEDLEEENYVSIMTIHKSKGLERPFVYIARLHSSMKITMDIYNKQFGFYFKTDEAADLINKEIVYQELRREKIRLLYVALTRAQESLTLIFDSEKKDFNGELNDTTTLQKLLLMNNDYNAYYETINLDEEINIISNDVDSYDNSVTYHFFTMKPKKLKIKNKASHDLYTENEEVFKAIERGTELHSYFELINFRENIEPQMEKYQIPVNDKNYLRSFKEQDIFNAETIREYHELPYFVNDNKGIIDYILELEDKYLIIDFKLKNIDDIEYVRQLKTYKEYLESRTNKKIETYLYSILNKELKPIDTNSYS